MKNIKRIKKTVIIRKLAEELNTSKAEAKRIYDKLFNTILNEINSNLNTVKTTDDVVTVSTPLWLVKVVKTKERMAVNPKNPTEKIKIKSKRKIKLNRTID